MSAAPQFLAARDARGVEVDCTSILPLLEKLVERWRPEQIWLFGSRARGDARSDSDWDLFAVVPQELPDEEIDPVAAWQLRKESRTRGHVTPCRVADFLEDRTTPNTIAYDVAREGVLLYER